VKKPNIMKLPRGLPKHLKEEQIKILFENLKGPRDRAMFYDYAPMRIAGGRKLPIFPSATLILNAESCLSKTARAPRIGLSISATTPWLLSWSTSE